MPDSLFPTSAEYFRILPEIILTLVGTLIMFLEAVLKGEQKRIFAPVSLAGLAAALYASVAANNDPGFAFHDMLVVDGFATFFRVLVIAVGILAVFASTEYLRRENHPGGEFFALILFSVMGQCIMVGGQ